MDLKKAAGNRQKHRVTFDEAMSIFGDPDELMMPDPDHSGDEERSISIGESSAGRLLTVIYTQVDNSIRLISAWEAEEGEVAGIWKDVVADMRKSYDFSNAVRGVHHRQYADGHSVQLISEDGESDVTSLVAPEANEEASIAILEPDVAAVFSDSKSVNEALRVLIKAAAQVQELAKAN